jgi:FAD/FMN-containing dehydrogenase
MSLSNPVEYEKRKAALLAGIAALGGQFSLRKRTSSNLFRYAPRQKRSRSLDLSGFNHVLNLDTANRILDVEGLATFESIADTTLPRGFAPLITPELKHITLGGATVGIGIESNCHLHGFVHDSLVEAEVLLGDGRIVTCTADNEHADLFRALGNSYGSLGYVLRAKIRLMRAMPFVHLRTTTHRNPEAFLDAMRAATEQSDVDFVEALMYDPDRLMLTVARYVEQVPHVDDILRKNVFYKLLAEKPDVYLTAKDYLFRYDPEWFWNLPESLPYRLLRRYAPSSMRHSGFYKRFMDFENSLPWKGDDGRDFLIQDWEVPWDRAGEMLRFALDNVDLDGVPWLAVAIRTPRAPSLYPIRPETLYFNLGCYCKVKRPVGREDQHYTRILDAKCFELGGVKMLYSSTFLGEEEFWRRYNGDTYHRLKAKYDPGSRLKDLYQKCVRLF